MSVTHSVRAYIPWLLFLLFASIVGFVVVANFRSYFTPKKEEQFPPPPYSESHYLNTGPDAQYIGIDACAECHQGRHDTYLHTAHSRAFAELDPGKEPPDGSFYHPASGRRYEVYRNGGKLYHKETIGKGEFRALLETDLPLRYVVGSGHVARSYIVEVDGFLHESPITWYTQQERWHMSPGYDRPGHFRFERAIDAACLQCHTGRVEAVGGALHRLNIIEMPIGCERCHGPGSLHRDRHLAGKPINGLDDLTIVNPSKLPRALADAVCAQCHLSGDASVLLRGRKVGDFRPGMPLTDFRIDYHEQRPGETMKVVGHFQQMRMSRCYQESTTLTCITCHDPHAKSKPKDPVVFFRQTCLTCHQLDSCGLEHAQRLQENAQDNCMACHMPEADSEVPHVAVTHHRIGLHTSQPGKESDAVGKFIAILKNTKLSEIDRERNLGLAYARAFFKPKQSDTHLSFQNLSLSLLQKVDRQGLSDGQTKEALARLFLKRRKPKKAVQYALEALETQRLEPRYRINATFIVASHEMQSGRIDKAIQLLKQLTRLHRHSDDWYHLGMCYFKQRDFEQALSSLKYSLSINPFRSATHKLLADVYLELTQPLAARKHNNAARLLSAPP